MDERQIGPDHSMDQPLNTTFEEDLANYNEDEKDRAQKMIEIYHSYLAMIKNSEVNETDKLKIYNLISVSINALIKEKGDEVVRRCKLFHLIVGSSLPYEQWEKYPLDTPDNDIEKFMSGPLLELLSEIETQKNNPH